MNRFTPLARSDCRRLWYAVLATALFFVAAIVQGVLRDDYDAWHQSISALSLGPAGWMQDVAFFVLGAALLSTIGVWRHVLADGIGVTWYPLLIALTGLSMLSAGVIPQDPAPGYDPEQLGHALPTVAGLIHLSVAGIGALATCGAILVMAARIASLPAWPKWWATYSRASGVLTMLCVALFGVLSKQPTGFAGVFERLVVVIPGVWGFALMARLSAGAPFVVTRASGQHDDASSTPAARTTAA